MSKKIIAFNWNNHQDIGDSSGNNLIIGQHLNHVGENELIDDNLRIETVGISLNTVDSKKDWQLHRSSAWGGNLVGSIKQVSKEEARTLLIAEIDKSLDIMFDDASIDAIDTALNVEDEIDENYED